MGILTSPTRRQLLDTLGAMSVFDTPDGRSMLLNDLPPGLVHAVERSTAKAVDLDRIVYTADVWVGDGAVGDSYPLRLLVQNAIDLARGTATGLPLQALLDTLPTQLDATVVRDACPYPGLRPFRPDEADRFYGREREIAQMLLRLRGQPFLLVIGPSGSGKSSLVFAGLLPALARQQPSAWHPVSFRPGTQPLQALRAALPNQPPSGRLLLVVDQLEEIFTQAGRDAQRGFIWALKALWGRPSVAVVLTLRADFYPDLMNSALWPVGEGERQEVGPLRGAALRTAIARPAQEVGVAVEDVLIERLLADAADEPGSLPLLQETLRLLWDQALGGRTLSLAAYEVLGRTYAATVPGSVGSELPSGLAVALALHADATMSPLTAPQQALARRIFLRLVQFGEGRPDTRRQQRVSALQATGDDPSIFAYTLATLIDSRLLTGSAHEGDREETADIAHEALIRHWPLLRGWLAERRGAEQTRRRLEVEAADWVRLGRGQGGLLDDVELAEAENWLHSPDAAELGTGEALTALVEASRASLRERAAREEAARQRELAQAQALAAEQQQRAEAEQLRADSEHAHAQAQRRARIQLGWLLGLVGVVAVVALGLLLRPWALSFVARGEVVPLAGGRAVIGTDDPSWGPDDMPQITPIVHPFAIERYEVANWQYRLCVDVTVCSPPVQNDGRLLFYDDHYVDYPVEGVVAVQAATYCRWIRRRLPTEVEWEFAARGPEGRLWPWGDTPPTAGRVNMKGITASAVLQKVDCCQEGQTPEHVFNLAGNVREWTRSYRTSGYTNYQDPTWDGQSDSLTTQQLAVRGGSWYVAIKPISQRDSAIGDVPVVAGGFRCVEDR